MTGKTDRQAVVLPTATMREVDIILVPETGIRLIPIADRRGYLQT